LKGIRYKGIKKIAWVIGRRPFQGVGARRHTPLSIVHFAGTSISSSILTTFIPAPW
jgi:hypothetical protein